MRKLLLTTAIVGILLAFGPHTVLAQCDPTQGYCLLAPLPLSGANSSGVTNQVSIAGYIPGAIMLTIAVAGGLAVLMMVIGGVKYITSATGLGKEDGKEKIKNALIGLILVIGAYTLLYTINPVLVQFNPNLIPPSQGGSSGTF